MNGAILSKCWLNKVDYNRAMQIREMNFKELDVIYELLVQLHTELSFQEFDDLIYDMRHIEYKMIGLFEKERLITYAGVAVETNFYHKRHLMVYDFVTDASYRHQGFGKEMLEYLEVYARTAMCENIVLSSGFESEKLFERIGFKRERVLFTNNIQ